ncbi:MAG: translocation/assembly module TamB domain-containing protein [Alistipes sp.]|nr:translocation/assembly module TamB domain-containing protein [Alistipes sp.]
MRKVIKILAKVVSVIILLSIFLPIATTLVLNVEGVQNVIVRRAADFATEYLGTKVSMRRIDLDLFSRVRVEGFLVEDHEQDTLLYVDRAAARLGSLNIPEDGLVIRWARAEDGFFNLKELQDGDLNIRPIVHKLQNPNGKNNFRMVISEIEGEGLEFRYKRLNPQNPEYGVDYFDMRISDVKAHLRDFSIMGSRVWSDIESLSAVERSGFVISNLTTRFSVDFGEIRFDDFVAQTPASYISVPEFVIKGEDWDVYKEYIDKVNMSGIIKESHIATSDLGYFAPALRDWNTEVSNIDASFEGVVRDLRGEINHATIGSQSVASGRFRIVGLPDWRVSKYIVGIERLYADSGDVEEILGNILKSPLPEVANRIIENMRWADARLTFGGRMDAFRAVGNIATAEGAFSADVSLSRNKDGRYDLSGSAKSDNLDIGSLLDIKALHRLSSAVTVNGSVGGADTGGVVADVGVSVSGVEMGAYRYSEIEGRGNISGRRYYAEVAAADPNLEFDLFANVDMESAEPAYALSMDLKRADLYAIGINRRDTTSLLSANIGVDIHGQLVENASGYISIADASYIYPGGELYTDLVRVETESDGAHKAVMLESEFLSLGYNSHSSYKEVGDYLYNSLMTYVPLLYNNTKGHSAATTTVNSPTDYTVLTIEAGESINSLLGAIDGKLLMAPDTELGLVFNPKSNNLTLRGSSEGVEYDGIILSNAELNVNNNSRDSLSVRVKSDAVYFNSRMLMPRFNIVGGARENRISLTAGFRQPDGNSSAMLGLSAQFNYNERSRRCSMHIDITPSHYTNDTQQWKLYSRGIDIDSSRIHIRELHIARPDQQMIIDGVASRQLSDSIRLTLDNFDISPISAILGRWGYNISGYTNGYASVKAALGTPEVEAAIDVDGLKVNDIAIPAQEVISNWDFEANRARVIIRDRGSRDTVIRGYYQPQGSRYYARAKMDGVQLSLISPFLSGIISDIEGSAKVEATVRGNAERAQLEGEAVVDNIGVTVDYMNVRYTAPQAKLTIKDNHIRANKIVLYDPENNVGHYSMDVDLNRLSNITYNIGIDVNKMLVLNTTAKDNDLFYGHVYASGEATFKGDRRGVQMDIDGTSAENSTFFMPLSGKEDVSYADFVQFREAKQNKADTTAFLTRRIMEYDRQQRAENTSAGMMDIDLSLNVLPNIEMQLVIDPTVGDVIKGRGMGQLTMHIVPKANIFEMRGDVQITEGTYLFTLQNILNKLFTVEPGSSIHWDGDPMGAILNINAVYNTKASLRPLLGTSVQGIDTSRAVPVECYIMLTDDLMSPTVTFDVKVPNVAPEIQAVIQSTLNDQQAIATQMFWLLAANCFTAEDTAAVGAASLSATTGFELISNQLSNWLSGDNYNIVLRYRPRTELSGDEVDFGFSKSWFNDRLIVEFEGGYLSDQSLQATGRASNFVGEAFITWLIDRDGTLRFKGFSQTVDRYGENQGMQESGVGLYYGESFNTFKELGQNFKNRFVHRDNMGRVLTHKEYRDYRKKQRQERKSEKTSGQQ